MSLVKCPDCGNDVSTRAATCPQCGAPVANAQQSAKDEPDPSLPVDTPAYMAKSSEVSDPQARGLKQTEVLILVLTVIAVIYGLSAGYSPSGERPTTSTATIAPGREARLSMGLMFTTESALAEARDASDHKRQIVALTMAGHVIGVDPGTRVSILDSSVWNDSYKIRILEGEMIGRTGYVPRSAVTP